jgi:uncharacterized membrane protein
MEYLSQLHPFIIHFPIAFLASYMLLEFCGAIFKKEFLSSAAFVLLFAGVVLGLAAVLTGNQASDHAKILLKNNPQEILNAIENHETFATITLWYFAALLVLRIYLTIKKKFGTGWKFGCASLGLTGCYFVYQTGALGGHLVYYFGIGTKIF